MSDKTETNISLEDVKNFDENTWAEVVNEEIITPDMSAASFRHVIIIDNLFRIIDPFVRTHKLGYFLTDGLTFVLSVDENGTPHTRIPDSCFIRRENLPTDLDAVFQGVPDLVVEVLSPTENPQTTLERINDFLTHGTVEGWIIHPKAQEVHRYLPERQVVYKAGETITTDLFPGLSIPVADLFKVDS